MMAAIALLFMSALSLCQAYPIIMEIDGNDRQCLEMNMPDGDDTHLLFILLDNNIATEAEDWFVTQMSEISREESSQFLKEPEYSNQPLAVTTHTKNARGLSKVTVHVDQIGSQPIASRTLNLSHFKLTKFEKVAEELSNSKGWSPTLGQYSICFSVRGRSDVRILFEAVQINEYAEKYRKRHTLKKEHLTPLEEAFDDGMSLAHSIIDEMHYMEKREVRMRQTADGTNSRLRYFSFLSIFILLSVTYLQISYLKNYFKKKKVL